MMVTHQPASDLSYDAFFSENYRAARDRFLDLVDQLGAEVHSYPINADVDQPLHVDVAIVGPTSGRAVMVSSGVHGVEGFLGSAIQLALLDQLRSGCLDDTRFVLVHGLNPYGFLQLRRVNEDNVDLNRNFLLGTEIFQGSPAGYRTLDPILNPNSSPGRFDLFWGRACWEIMVRGLQSLKETIAHGQYDYPLGLFFGGKRPSQSMRIVQEHAESWLASAQQIVHIDIHTGLGRFAGYKLLIDNNNEAPWFAEHFGAQFVEAPDATKPTAYDVSGQFASWLQHSMSDREYRFLVAEFGTRPSLRVLAALRAENRAHHFGDPDHPSYLAAKRELLECFCPSEKSWRQQTVASGLKIIKQASVAVMD